MNKTQISRYFTKLAKIFPEPCLILLTGAAAGSIYGSVRPTRDLDFALRFKARSKRQKEKLWQEFRKATEQISLQTGIAVQYAEDIDRWSSITYLDYDQHTLVFKRFGSMEVRLLQPIYWAIGKLARSLEPDIRDLIKILKKTKTQPKKLARILGTALRKSPKSTACELFRRQVENFFKEYGKQIWGKRFVLENTIQVFHQAAQIR